MQCFRLLKNRLEIFISKLQVFRHEKISKTFLNCIDCLCGVTAQGDGPRNIIWGPTGVTALNAKWMSLNQNLTPGNIYIKDAEIKIDVFPLTLVHNFNLGGRFAQIMFNATPGSASGRVVPDPPGVATSGSEGFRIW